MSQQVDSKTVNAVTAAQPKRGAFWLPLLRHLLFHIYFIPSTLALLPLYILRSLIPFLKKHPQWSFTTSMGILLVRHSMRNFIRFGLQPLAPRENGWREAPGIIGAFLALLNFSGPGGYIRHPEKALKAALKVSGGKRLDRVWIDPAPLEAYRGILSIQASSKKSIPPTRVKTNDYNGPALIEAAWAKTRIRCFWFMHTAGATPPESTTSPGHAAPSRNVILYIHGGAGVTFSAGDMFMGQCLALNLARESKTDVFSVDYNLAPFAPYPIPISQALAGWYHLTRGLGYKPEQIYIGGDSFGAHTTLLLDRFLRLEGPKLDLERQSERPAGLLLLSPWLDASQPPHCEPGTTFKRQKPILGSSDENWKYDIIPPSYPAWGLDSMKMGMKWKKHNPLSLKDPWLSPVYFSPEEFKTLPPIFQANGGLEVLLDQGRDFAKKVRAAGVPFEFHIEPFMPHDYFTMDTEVVRARKNYKKFGEWIRKNEGYKV